MIDSLHRCDSSGRYELEVRVDGFSWSYGGSDFSYPQIAADLKLNPGRQLVTSGNLRRIFG